MPRGSPRDRRVACTNKPVGTLGSWAKVTLIESGSRVEVPLRLLGDNRHRAQGSFNVRPGMSALLEVSVAGQPVAKLRYTLK